MKYFKSAYYAIIRVVHWHDVDASGAIRHLLQTASIMAPSPAHSQLEAPERVVDLFCHFAHVAACWLDSIGERTSAKETVIVPDDSPEVHYCAGEKVPQRH